MALPRQPADHRRIRSWIAHNEIGLNQQRQVVCEFFERPTR